MHIVYLVSTFPIKGLATSGAGNYVANMAQIMKSHGHKVSVITEAKENAHIVWDGIDVYYIQATKGFRNTGMRLTVYEKVFRNLSRSFWYNRKAYEISEGGKVDIIQCVNMYGIGLFRLKKIPYIIRMSADTQLWSASIREKFNVKKALGKGNVDEYLQLCALKRANLVFAPSNLIADITGKRIKKEVKTIESPIMLPHKEELIFEEVLFEKDKYFLTFGANTNRKSIQMLAGEIDTILDMYPDMKYVVIGNDKLIEYKGGYAWGSEIYRDMVVRNKERFLFMGEISDRRRLFSIIENAILCILPTRIDNLPNTVLEAMALGKIVISSTSELGTSVEQLIVDGENGFLVQVDDAEELIKKLEMVMGLSHEEKMSIGQKAKERVGDLKPELVYEKMIDIYMTVIESFK